MTDGVTYLTFLQQLDNFRQAQPLWIKRSANRGDIWFLETGLHRVVSQEQPHPNSALADDDPSSVRSVPGVVWNYSLEILWDKTYQVPVLYFRVSDASTAT
jgi:hypothetical protein